MPEQLAACLKLVAVQKLNFTEFNVEHLQKRYAVLLQHIHQGVGMIKFFDSLYQEDKGRGRSAVVHQKSANQYAK